MKKVIPPVWHHAPKQDVAGTFQFSQKGRITEDGLESVVRRIWEVMASQPTRFQTMVNLELREDF